MLAVLLLTGAPAMAETDNFHKGRFACERPDDAAPSVREYDGVFSVRYKPRLGLVIEVLAYRWGGGGLFHDFPKDAAQFIERLSGSELPDSRIIEGPTLTEFQGYPAWWVVRRYTIREPYPATGVTKVQEGYLVIQRRWGFVVVEYINAPEFFQHDLQKLEAFKGGLKLLPEPPGGPWLLVVIPVFLVACIIVGATRWILRRRAAAR